jgi:uncharacterized protein YozE (UPF0346 family)
MKILKEFTSSRGPKKAYIVDTLPGLRVMVQSGPDGSLIESPTRDEDGTITYHSPDDVPQYARHLVEQAFRELDALLAGQITALTFTQWLLTQCHRRDVIGELARGAEADRRWPHRGESLEDFRRYLGVGTQTRGLLAALEAAWAEYEQAAKSSQERP